MKIGLVQVVLGIFRRDVFRHRLLVDNMVEKRHLCELYKNLDPLDVYSEQDLIVKLNSVGMTPETCRCFYTDKYYNETI